MFPDRFVVSAHNPARDVGPNDKKETGCYAQIKIRVDALPGGGSRKYNGLGFRAYEGYGDLEDQYSYAAENEIPKSRGKRVSAFMVSDMPVINLYSGTL